MTASETVRNAAPGAPRDLASRLGPWVVVLAAVVAYLPSFGAPFVFDDGINIVDNPLIRSLWPPRWALGNPRPVTLFTFALNYAACGYRVAGWHAVNLAIHAAAALVLFDLVRRTCALPRLAPRLASRASWIALGSATLWALHPLHTSAVTYVVHRYESLAGLFYLLTLDLFARSVVAERPAALRVATVAACLLGMASKEIVVTAPMVVLLFDRCFVATRWRDALSERRTIHGALFAIWAVVAVLVALAPHSPSQGFGFEDLRPIDYARSEIGAIVHYLRLALWPDQLSIDYYDWPVARSLGEVALPAVVLGAIVLAGAFALAKAPPLGFWALAWLVVLAPTSSFYPLRGELVAERRMYVPLAFLIVGAVALVDAAMRSRRRTELSLLVATATALGVATFVRNASFRTPEGMYADILAARPANVRARYHLGLELDHSGRADEALAAFERAAADEPGCWACANNAGALLAKRGRWAEAERYFARAAALRPAEAAFRDGLEAVLVQQGKWAEAVEVQRGTVALAPDAPAQLEKLARLLASAPDARVRRGAEAVELAERAVAASSRAGQPSARARATLAAAYAEAGRWDDAARTAQALIDDGQRAGREPMVRTGAAMLARFRAREAWREADPAHASSPAP